MSRPLLYREDTRFRALRLLQDNPELTQREIANQLGLSLGGVNYSIRTLVDKGLLKIQNFRKSKNKMGYAYFLTPRGISEKMAITESFLKRKMREHELLQAEQALLAARKPDY